MKVRVAPQKVVWVNEETAYCYCVSCITEILMSRLAAITVTKEFNCALTLASEASAGKSLKALYKPLTAVEATKLSYVSFRASPMVR